MNYYLLVVNSTKGLKSKAFSEILMVREELERIIEVANEKITFFESCSVEQFPAELSDSVRAMTIALSEGRPIPESALRAIQSSEAIAGRSLHYLVRHFDCPFEMSELMMRHFGAKMAAFFEHDKAHLSASLFMVRDAFSTVTQFGKLTDEVVVDPEFYPRRLREINAVTDRIARMYGHPWRLIKFLAEGKLGIQPIYEPVSLQRHFRDVAEVLSLRFGADVCYVSNPATPLKKSISITGEDITILADNGLIWSVVYNNLKNAQKKFLEDEEMHFTSQGYGHRLSMPDGLRAEAFVKYLQSIGGERVSKVSCYNLNDGYVAIVFSDSGSPIDLNKMVSGIRNLMRDGSKGDLDWVNAGMGQRFNAWAANDYCFNRLTIEDVTNAAFMARVGGSETNSISSGMGLYGTRQIIESLGGAILYTTTFKDENPVFVYILPRKPVQNRAEALQIRENIIESGIRAA